MQQEMMLRDEETMELRGTYTSLQQEVEVKTKKLKKVSCCSRMGSRCAEGPGASTQDSHLPKGCVLQGALPLLHNCRILSYVTWASGVRSREETGVWWGWNRYFPPGPGWREGS